MKLKNTISSPKINLLTCRNKGSGEMAHRLLCQRL
ncbi:mCG147696 [Mus musculus]|nr:mCG147696 [Mus musculus]